MRILAVVFRAQLEIPVERHEAVRAHVMRIRIYEDMDDGLQQIALVKQGRYLAAIFYAAFVVMEVVLVIFEVAQLAEDGVPVFAFLKGRVIAVQQDIVHNFALLEVARFNVPVEDDFVVEVVELPDEFFDDRDVPQPLREYFSGVFSFVNKVQYAVEFEVLDQRQRQEFIR